MQKEKIVEKQFEKSHERKREREIIGVLGVKLPDNFTNNPLQTVGKHRKRLLLSFI